MSDEQIQKIIKCNTEKLIKNQKLSVRTIKRLNEFET